MSRFAVLRWALANPRDAWRALQRGAAENAETMRRARRVIDWVATQIRNEEREAKSPAKYEVN